MTRIASRAYLALSILTLGALPAAGSTEQVLYNFTSPKYGVPLGRLMLYNNAFYGLGSGVDGCCGQAFQLKLSGGVWKESQLVKFGSGGDGQFPRAGLIHDSSGFFYGTTSAGGSNGAGTVFELQSFLGSWTATAIWNFGGSGDGAGPSSDLILSSSKFYGTTQSGGAHGLGTVFELYFDSGTSTWVEKVIYSFAGGSDGANPYAGLHRDSSTGAFYGTTFAGGASGKGIVFELTQSGGKWTESVLWSFGSGTDGAQPADQLIEDSKGNLYGTTSTGGTTDSGTVFELAKSGGSWVELILYSFTGLSDGGLPWAGLHMDSSGNLFGTTESGGTGGGTVYELPTTGGEKVLHSFGGSGDGLYPQGGLIEDSKGALYGTTPYGGTGSEGTVYKVVP